MLNDNELMAVTREMDAFLFELTQKYQISTLSLSAITFARLMRLTREDSSDKDFRKLMSQALNDTENTKIKRTLQ